MAATVRIGFVAGMLFFGLMVNPALLQANPDFGPPPPDPKLSLQPAPSDAEQIECQFTKEQIGLLEKLNRCERALLARLDSLVVPDFWYANENRYAPLPVEEKRLASFPKAVVVDRTLQAFAAYEGGRLVRWGPVSTGARQTPTPAGLFALNWRSRGHRSTVNRDWYLPWYFNFSNRRGFSFHQYSLPGEPASHGCVRLLGRDAFWLYEWGDEWQLDERGWNVLQPGTPVLIVGDYDYESPAPWRAEEFLAAGAQWAPESLPLPEETLAAAPEPETLRESASALQ